MDSRVDHGRGHTKRRTLDENYAERFPNPTRATSPRQLPTDHVHAVPTRVYQCDQSSRQLPGCDRSCRPSRKRSRLTSGNVFPPAPPSAARCGARTVLAGKGSLRRAPHRRALARSAPFRPDQYAMGGSGGNTWIRLTKKAKIMPISKGG